MTASSGPSFHSDKLRSLTTTSTGSASSDEHSEASPASTPVKTDVIKNHVSSSSFPIPLVRNHIFRLSALVGQLSALVLQHFPMDHIASSSDVTNHLHFEDSTQLSLLVSQLWSTLL